MFLKGDVSAGRMRRLLLGMWLVLVFNCNAMAELSKLHISERAVLTPASYIGRTAISPPI